MIIIGCTGPPTPEKFRMYHNLVAAPALLVMIGPSATVYLYIIFGIQRPATCTAPVHANGGGGKHIRARGPCARDSYGILQAPCDRVPE
jgi:hypothetical protein